jgi:hypothetical protein
MIKDSHDLLAFLREYICDNQAALSQYIFTANEKHKAIKEFLNEVKSFPEGADTEVNEKYRENLSKLIIELDEHLLVNFGKIFEKTYGYIIRYFQSRSALPPRATIKVIDSNKIATLLKMPEFFIENTYIDIAENSAFRAIAEDQKYYLCNDIPTGIVQKLYKNKRIDLDKASNFVKRKREEENALSERFKGRSRDIYDLDWAACWKPVRLIDSNREIQPPAETCYKATLVVPMSLQTSKITKDFKTQFKISESKKRAIFGFLCFDHVLTDFFNESDVDFAYILADMLSLYLIYYLMHTQYSSVYYEAKLLVAIQDFF